MRDGTTIGVIIPPRDEEAAIALVIDAIPPWVDHIVVVDNGCRDATATIARACEVVVAEKPRRGYGAACQYGTRALPAVDVVVFLDADYSDFPEQMDRLVDPRIAHEANLVIGIRTERAGSGGLPIHQKLGNRLACGLIHLLWGRGYADVGPFRSIRRECLETLSMRDLAFSWTVEMQVKALCEGVVTPEMPVDYRPRIGNSKISGTWMGSVRAGSKILWTIVALRLRRWCRCPHS